MLTDFLLMSLLLVLLKQQNQLICEALNFNAIGLTWNFEVLYVLYNNDTTEKQMLYEQLEKIFSDQSDYFYNKPFIVADMKTSYMNLHEIGGFSYNPLMIIMAAHIYDPVLIRVNRITRGKKNICIIIYLKEFKDEKELHLLIEYLFQRQYRRVLVVTITRHLYSMKPYPLVHVINVTGKPEREYFVPQITWNLEGYKIRVPVQIDVPNMFWYYDDTVKRIRMDGIGGIVFEAFMKTMNVTLETYPLYVNDSNYLNIACIQEMLMNDSIEISPHLYTTLHRKPIDYSYSYITTSRCMMLPVMQQLQVSHVLPYHRTIWVFILLIIVVSEAVCQLVLRCQPEFLKNTKYHRYFQPGTVGLYLVCLLSNIPLPDTKMFNIRRDSFRQYMQTLYCYALIGFTGFCFSQMYSSSLTSGLTVSISIKPKTSVEQILNMKQPIMATDQARKLFLYDQRFGYRALRKIVFTTPEEFHINRMHMNTSYVYPTSEDRWNVLKEQQQFLSNKLFWLSDVCVGNFPLQFQMRLDSPFKPYLRKFILYVRETGLYSHWKSNIFRRAKRFGYMSYFKERKSLEGYDTRKVVKLTLGSLTFYLYSCGMLFSCVIFVLEWIYGKLRKA
ncbi:hypothetical protein FF38_02746 [Lucilia cuprina]|uniref:Ionotropic glutamate receptor C-terminal domain-containing protein n=1 Tax=Lucilia cuprina TaxID=7375 RepID=A0A0L0CSU2_LUCCU|nr:hypothetical protein CVS40_0756 [Lucilia cuprina]KNC34469.1 hypothetical protein FF38_02746 [Lucilia cuprina]